VDTRSHYIRDLPPYVSKAVFNRFYKVDYSRLSSTGGTGLGLAIARQIARRHNGDVSITSSPDSGTFVSIRLAHIVRPDQYPNSSLHLEFNRFSQSFQFVLRFRDYTCTK
jgi:hypothetical protein